MCLHHIPGCQGYRIGSKRVNALLGSEPGPIWQRNYYERIIRDQREYERDWRYLKDNPGRWAHDVENPASTALRGARV